jgi:hypothetical protein
MPGAPALLQPSNTNNEYCLRLIMTTLFPEEIARQLVGISRQRISLQSKNHTGAVCLADHSRGVRQP